MITACSIAFTQTWSQSHTSIGNDIHMMRKYKNSLFTPAFLEIGTQKVQLKSSSCWKSCEGHLIQYYLQANKIFLGIVSVLLFQFSDYAYISAMDH